VRPGGDPIRRRPAATLAVDAGRTTAAVNHPVEGDLNANAARNSTGGISYAAATVNGLSADWKQSTTTAIPRPSLRRPPATTPSTATARTS